MMGVRHNDVDGWEGRCDGCGEWWPLDREFWPAGRRGMRHCRGCEALRRRADRLLNLQKPGWREDEQAKHAAYRKIARDALALKQRERRRLRILTEPGFLERHRTYQAAYMRRKRAERNAA